MKPDRPCQVSRRMLVPEAGSQVPPKIRRCLNPLFTRGLKVIFMSNCKFEGVEKSLLRLLPPFFFFGGRSRLKPVIGYLAVN